MPWRQDRCWLLHTTQRNYCICLWRKKALVLVSEVRVLRFVLQLNNTIIDTVDTCRQKYFLNKLLDQNQPLLFVGPTGTGKSVISKAYLRDLPKKQFSICHVNFSAQTSASQTQDMIFSKLDRQVSILSSSVLSFAGASIFTFFLFWVFNCCCWKYVCFVPVFAIFCWDFRSFFRRRKGIYGPSPGKRMIVFVDDLNMPAKERYGAQPPIELLRQWVDHGHWFDRKVHQAAYVN